MSRYKHKKTRVGVYFQYNGSSYKLFEAINFGTKTEPELKIKSLSETYMQIKDDQNRFDGQFHVGQMIRFVDGNHVEFTYHKDGSILEEVIHPSGEKEYSNPYGTGERWTPLSEVTTCQPVMIFQIKSLASYRKAFVEEKYGLKNYFVKNDRLFVFAQGQEVIVLVYIKHKDYPLAKYCFDDAIYSDVIMKLGESLELCVFIQKQKNYDNRKAMINNHFMFVDRLDGVKYLEEELYSHIFHKPFVDFLEVVQEGNCYFDFSEAMMQVMESADPFYNDLIARGTPILVHKPVLVRRLLDNQRGNYEEYLKKNKKSQMQYIIALYQQMSLELSL